MSESIGIEDARKRLGDLATAAQYGQSTTLTRNGRPIARIVPIEENAMAPIVLVAAPRHTAIPGSTILDSPDCPLGVKDLPVHAQAWVDSVRADINVVDPHADEETLAAADQVIHVMNPGAPLIAGFEGYKVYR